jgi:hypothetical protein
MFRSNRHQWFRLGQSLEAQRTAIGFTPLDFLLDVVEQRHDVLKAVLNINVAVSDRDQDDFEILRRSCESQEHSHDIVASLADGQRWFMEPWIGMDMYAGSEAYWVSVDDELTRCHFGDGLGLVNVSKRDKV